jgi:FkbM family methyltransferase
MFKQLRNIIRSFGIDVVRYHPPQLDAVQKILTTYQTKLVIDGGANVGQYAKKTFRNGYKGKIISIEPQIEAYQELLQQITPALDWQIYRRCALSNVIEKALINVTQNSESSSLLNLNVHSSEANEGIVVVRQEEVEVTTLNQINRELNLLATYSSIYLKLDLQGHELKALQGATDLLQSPHLKVVQLEMALHSTYQDEPNWLILIEFMEAHGFEVFHLFPGFTHGQTGQLLEIDGVFVRKTNKTY